MFHMDLLLQANTFNNPVDRFLSVLKYTLSTCSLTKFPYKPIIAFLGETAQSYTRHNYDGMAVDTTYYVGEQVEREPATSAFYICNPVRGVIHEGSVEMIPKFKQAHIHVRFVGQRKTILAHPQGLWNEVYVADVPDLMIRLIRMHTELGGGINLTCATTGMAASLQFKDKPVFGGQKNLVSGRITHFGRELYQIEGVWDDVVYLVDSNTKLRFEFLNRGMLRRLKVESYPLEQQPESSGEKVWGQLIETLLAKDFDTAKAVKVELDAEGQERLARYEQQGGFVSSYFRKNPSTGAWEIKDASLVCVPPATGDATM